MEDTVREQKGCHWIFRSVTVPELPYFSETFQETEFDKGKWGITSLAKSGEESSFSLYHARINS